MGALIRFKRHICSVDENDQKIWHLELNVALHSAHRDKLLPLLQKRDHDSAKHAMKKLEREKEVELVQRFCQETKRTGKGNALDNNPTLPSINNEKLQGKDGRVRSGITQYFDHLDDETEIDWHLKAHQNFREERRRALIEDLHHSFMNPQILWGGNQGQDGWYRYLFGSTGGAAGRSREWDQRAISDARGKDPNRTATARTIFDSKKVRAKEKLQKVL